MSFCSDFLPGIRLSFGGPFADTILAAVEFDMLTRPYVHRNTLLSSMRCLRRLRVPEKRHRGWLIECPYDIPREAALLREGKRTAPLMEPIVIAIDHERGQMYRDGAAYPEGILGRMPAVHPRGQSISDLAEPPQQDIFEPAAPGVGAAGKADEKRMSAP